MERGQRRRITDDAAGLAKFTVAFPPASGIAAAETVAPRVPVAGDRIRLPDDVAWWEVLVVKFDYKHGFYYEPDITVIVRLA